MPTQPYKVIREDLERVGIPYRTAEGKVDFHACRVAYINLVVDNCTDLKTVQTLARHSDPTLTMNVYAKAKKNKLESAAAAVGRAIFGADSD